MSLFNTIRMSDVGVDDWRQLPIVVTWDGNVYRHRFTTLNHAHELISAQYAHVTTRMLPGTTRPLVDILRVFPDAAFAERGIALRGEEENE